MMSQALAMWVLYTIIGVTVFSLIFIWAVRTRQFSDQDRARYLPLAGIKDAPTAPEAEQHGQTSPPRHPEPRPPQAEEREACPVGGSAVRRPTTTADSSAPPQNDKGEDSNIDGTEG